MVDGKGGGDIKLEKKNICKGLNLQLTIASQGGHLNLFLFPTYPEP